MCILFWYIFLQHSLQELHEKAKLENENFAYDHV